MRPILDCMCSMAARVLKMSEEPLRCASASSTDRLPVTCSEEPLDKCDDNGKKMSYKER